MSEPRTIKQDIQLGPIKQVDIGRQIYHQHSLFIYVYIYIYINMLLPIFEIEVADLPTSSGEAVRCASDSRHEQL
jgi:hypothetical protein